MTAQDLFNHCARLVQNYPQGTIGLTSGFPVAGCGFFPVASGSFHDGCLTTSITPRKLMFIGQDWGCEDNLGPLNSYKDADIKFGTGKILLNLLKEARIPLNECFFTNALFGVRSGATNTGPSPGWNDQKFVDCCADALRVQIEAVRPKGIICLGRAAPALMMRLMSECAPWQSAKSFTAIDKAGNAVIRIGSLPRVNVAAILVHPSFRAANAKCRWYRGSTNNDAEMRILADVWSAVGSAATD
jgi:uracil-DNA glycosylase family 4